MKNKGLIIGFIVGVLSVPLALLGLSFKFGIIFYPLIILPKVFTFGFANIPALIISSIIIYSLIGFLIEYLLKKYKRN